MTEKTMEMPIRFVAGVAENSSFAGIIILCETSDAKCKKEVLISREDFEKIRWISDEEGVSRVVWKEEMDANIFAGKMKYVWIIKEVLIRRDIMGANQ